MEALLVPQNSSFPQHHAAIQLPAPRGSSPPKTRNSPLSKKRIGAGGCPQSPQFDSGRAADTMGMGLSNRLHVDSGHAPGCGHDNDRRRNPSQSWRFAGLPICAGSSSGSLVAPGHIARCGSQRSWAIASASTLERFDASGLHDDDWTCRTFHRSRRRRASLFTVGTPSCWRLDSRPFRSFRLAASIPSVIIRPADLLPAGLRSGAHGLPDAHSESLQSRAQLVVEQSRTWAWSLAGDRPGYSGSRVAGRSGVHAPFRGMPADAGLRDDWWQGSRINARLCFDEPNLTVTPQRPITLTSSAQIPAVAYGGTENGKFRSKN